MLCQRIIVNLITCIAVATMFAPACVWADDVVEPPPGLVRILAYWRADGANVGISPQAAVTQMMNKEDPLRTAMGSPLHAAIMFPKPPMPAGMSYGPGAAENFLERYLVLTYGTSGMSRSVALSSMSALLTASGRVGYVADAEQPAGDSSGPTDRFFSSAPLSTVTSQFQYGFGAPISYVPQGLGAAGSGQIGLIERAPHFGHPDLVGSFALNYVQELSFGTRYPVPQDTFGDIHGTAVAGVMAARATFGGPAGQGEGIVGVCYQCTIAATVGSLVTERTMGAQMLSRWGVPVVNLSGFMPGSSGLPQDIPPPCVMGPSTYNANNHPFCAALLMMEQRDVAFVASAGNFRSSVHFPANEDIALSVGGAFAPGDYTPGQYRGTPISFPSFGHEIWRVWDERILPIEPGDRPSGCPAEYNTTDLTDDECGSNYGVRVDFIAPAKNVVVPVRPGSELSSTCSDASFPPAGDGYARCTGTSFSAPYVSGALAVMRSLAPLVTASSFREYYRSRPMRAVLGSFAGNIISAWETVQVPMFGVTGDMTLFGATTRLTPLFVAKRTTAGPVLDGYPDGTQDRVYSTRPQVAQSAVLGELGLFPYCLSTCSNGYAFGGTAQSTPVPYQQVSSAEASVVRIAGGLSASTVLRYPSDATIAGLPAPSAPFHVFTRGGVAPPIPTAFGSSTLVSLGSLVPLYRLSIFEPLCFRGHFYTTSLAEVVAATTNDQCASVPGAQTYSVDAIEGYLLSTCPPALPACDGSGSHVPVSIHRRYSAVENNFALLRADQLSLPEFASYTGLAFGQDIIGYAFRNIDTDIDGLIDAQELFYSRDPLRPSTNCSGAYDSTVRPPRAMDVWYINPSEPGCG